MNKRVLPQSF